MKEKSFLLSVSIFIIVLILGLTGYAYYQKTVLETEVSVLELEYDRVSKQISQTEYLDTMKLFSAKQVLDRLDKDFLKWSRVIRDIQDTIPKDDRGVQKLDVVAYSGSGGSELTLNVSTVAGSSQPFFDVADFIQSFNQSNSFLNNFVPSISSGVTAEGRPILTFSFSTTYREDKGLILR